MKSNKYFVSADTNIIPAPIQAKQSYLSITVEIMRVDFD